jgi:trimethylamine--corrinoid protein Co-methyltransferase
MWDTGAYIALSQEIFLADEEIYGILRRMLQPLEITDERIDFETIKSEGRGCEYRIHLQTFKHCRTEFYLPGLLQKNDYSTLVNRGRKELFDVAEQKVNKRLEQWEKPKIQPDVEIRLTTYIKANM